MRVLFRIEYSNRQGTIVGSAHGLTEEVANSILKVCQAARFNHKISAYIDQVYTLKKPQPKSGAANHNDDHSSDWCKCINFCEDSRNCRQPYSSDHSEDCLTGEVSPRRGKDEGGEL